MTPAASPGTSRTEHAPAPPAAEKDSIVIIGAGLTGSLLAVLLGRKGLPVTVFERRSDPRVDGAERGRSINLALSARGLAALQQIGLEDLALGVSLPMAGRMVHPVDGPPNLQPYSADGRHAINSISRTLLNIELLNAAAETPGVELVFDHKLTEISLDEGNVLFETPAGEKVIRARTVFGADGAFSTVRKHLAERGGFRVDVDSLGHGYKELSIPATDAGDFALDPHALHIWARGDSMMIALPNQDRSFTCTLFWPRTGPGGFDRPATDAEIGNYFAEHYPDAVPVMPTLADDYRNNPIGSLVTVRTWPWFAAGKRCTAALVGDAAHAIVPFYGQGANCGFEDTVALSELYDAHGPDWPAIFADYQQRRKPDTDAIARFSLANFVEMRDSVNRRSFRAKSAVEHAVGRATGGRFKSLYELVSFTTVPYSKIRRRRAAQLAGIASGTVGLVGGFRFLRTWGRRRRV
ncbi:MAG: hypothetical protein BGO26_00840 [Actinobacteria bacterium 69-20]|jgi:kynurenine 3-monooxygenase|nr:FAD-dependent monooxygenase [Actinomycetota bacterium]OJV28554.1 MAG: hypothetical protein BGO26_00840 [Actinobacteria bacterium 69-20]